MHYPGDVDAIDENIPVMTALKGDLNPKDLGNEEYFTPVRNLNFLIAVVKMKCKWDSFTSFLKSKIFFYPTVGYKKDQRALRL